MGIKQNAFTIKEENLENFRIEREQTDDKLLFTIEKFIKCLKFNDLAAPEIISEQLDSLVESLRSETAQKETAARNINNLVDNFINSFNPLTNCSDNFSDLAGLITILLAEDENDDEDEGSNDFFDLLKCFFLQLLIKICSLSKLNCSKLSAFEDIHILLMKLISDNDRLLSTSARELFVLISSVELKPSNLIELCSLAIERNEEMVYSSLISKLLDIQNYSHLNFLNSSITFDVKPKKVLTCFTIQFWIKFNNFFDQIIYHDNKGLELRLESMRLSIYNNNILVGRFENYLFDDENVYYNLVLIHHIPNSTSSSSLMTLSKRADKGVLKLYVNSEFIQNVKCPFFVSMDEDYSESLALNDLSAPSPPIEITIGSKACDFNIANFLFIDAKQPYEWILLSNSLGPSYQGNFTDGDLLKLLNYKQRTQFNLKLLELSNSNENFDIENLNLTIPVNDLLVCFNTDFVKNFKKLSNVDSNLVSNDSSIRCLGQTFIFSNKSIVECFYSIGSIQLIFNLIENSKNEDSLYKSVSILLKLINTDWKIISEIESISGYNILSTILKLKKSELNINLSVKFLDLFLEFIGYNFQSPFNSVIVNHVAYDALILDFSLWKSIKSKVAEPNSETLEIFKFLIFQLTVFSKECKYNSFNLLKLKKLKVVKKFLHYLIQGYFSENLYETIHNSLLTFVKLNLTVDIIRSLSGFVILALNDGNITAAVLVLRVLAEVFLDPFISNVNLWKKLFGSISIKWILLLIQFGLKEKFIIDVSLTMMIKIFLVTPSVYELFIKNNGLAMILSSLRDIEIDNVELNILINGSYGDYQYDLNFKNLTTSLTDNKPFSNKVSLPELHYLLVDVIEWTVLNDIFKDESHDAIIKLIDNYSDFLTTATEISNDTNLFFRNDKLLSRKLCNLIILLTKSQNTTIYFDSSEKIAQYLSSIILYNLFKTDISKFEPYLTNFLSKSDDGSNNVTTYIFLILVFPKVLNHMVEFSSEYEALFSSGVVHYNNLAYFLNWLADRLLDVKWDIKDYFNYMAILLESIEAYKKIGANLKSSYYLLARKNITTISNILVLAISDTESIDQKLEFLKSLLFHQQNLFPDGALSNDGTSNLICLLVKLSVTNDSNVSSLSLNCLRILLMHKQNEMSSICSCITFRSYLALFKFLESVLSVGDEEVLATLSVENQLLKLFLSHLDNFKLKMLRKNTNNKLESVQEIIQKLCNRHETVIKNKYEAVDTLVNMVKNDNENLRIKIVSLETNKNIKFILDQQDNMQFFITQYNKLKLDTTKLLSVNFGDKGIKTVWTLDHMESIDRMRKRLIPYDDLASDEKLSYTFEVPIKQQTLDSSHNETPATAESQTRNDTISLNSFELIENDFSTEEANSSYNDKNRKVLKSLYSGDRICELWNVSQVVGLEINEGILILGETHIYLIQNYFHKSETDEIIDINDAPVESRDPNVKLITGQPRAKGQIQSHNQTQRGNVTDSHTVLSWEIYKMTSVTKRQFLLRDVALEIFFNNGSSFLITCIKTKDRNTIYSKLSNVATNSDIDGDLSTILKETSLDSLSGKAFTSKLASVFTSEEIYLEATKKWQRGDMSNFYYLMIINTLAGRTFNDLTQYPVFPWVLADYSSGELDLSDPKSFRDLSKPMGAQSANRAKQFKERYEALESLQDPNAPPFHYGTHYSSAMIVASFLIRLEPFVQSYLLLQGGKFDHADRLFYSIEKAWLSSSRDNTTDVRELIPEFFFLPEFLTNINGYEFGKLQDGKEISHVELPKWANNDPKVFIAKNREALESPYVSEHLHEWIDLIFGFKQTGIDAIENLNVFNHLSYHGAIDLDSIDDEVERGSITGIIHNFGQTPMQIFNKPHPKKECVKNLSLNFNKIKTLPTLMYQSKFHEPIFNLQYKTHNDNSMDAFWRGYPKLILNGESEIKTNGITGSLTINRKTFEGLHGEEITTINRFNNELILTGSVSGVIHVWRFFNFKLKGLSFERIEFESALRGHLFRIIELFSSPEYNLLLSLDERGNCNLWDLARYKFIRKIDTEVDHCSIAYDSGLIAVSKKNRIKIFTINGEIVVDEVEINCEITCLNFANSRRILNSKLKTSESHEYWKEYSILSIGCSNGVIKLYEIVLSNDCQWGIELRKSLRFSEVSENKNNEYSGNSISVIEVYLKSFINFDEERIGKSEIISGDVNGRIAVWRA